LIIYCNKTKTLSSASTVVAQWFKLLPIIHKVLGSIPVRYILNLTDLSYFRQSSQRPLAVLDFVHLRVTQIIFYFKKAISRLSYLEKG
jgi:hypothetical protein